jgi:UDPglucose 6-dehydrogenase
VQAYDPAGIVHARRTLPDVDYRDDAYSAAEKADALVLITEWNQFRNLDFDQLRRVMRRPLLLDLRNVYDPERLVALGFEYHGVGRTAPAVRPSPDPIPEGPRA